MDIKKYEGLLIKKRRETEAFLERLKESSKPVDLNDPIGRLSRMDAIQQQQMSLESKNRALLTLKQIDAALGRFKDDSYGVCLKCEEEISEKRLMAKPESPFCSLCQS